MLVLLYPVVMRHLDGRNDGLPGYRHKIQQNLDGMWVHILRLILITNIQKVKYIAHHAYDAGIIPRLEIGPLSN